MLIKFLLNGKQINLTGDNTTITSSNFNVDKNGNMSCTNANVSGTITSNNATINGGTLKLQGGTLQHPDFVIGDENSQHCSIISEQISLRNGSNERFFVNTSTGGGVFFELYSATNNCHVDINLLNNGGTAWFNLNDVWFSNEVHALSYAYDSKAEIKKDIKKYTQKALDIIKNTDVYQFNYKEYEKKKKTIGFVIGDNYKIADEIVTDERNGINSYSVMGILWKSIQEQQEIIEQLQKEVKELKEGKENG